MVYNFTNPLDVQSAKTRLASLIKRCCIVELTEKKPKRSVQQNKYLHVILGYFASQTGNTLQYVKDNYYKKLCNHDLFVYYRNDPWIGRTEDLRSTADLRVDEMNLSIERFRNWAAAEPGIYLPEARNWAEVAALEVEVERYKTYL